MQLITWGAFLILVLRGRYFLPEQKQAHFKEIFEDYQEVLFGCLVWQMKRINFLKQKARDKVFT